MTLRHEVSDASFFFPNILSRKLMEDIDNDTDDFNMPDHYIRHIEPIEVELAHQVEYDMDEQGAPLISRERCLVLLTQVT